jgi:hypothetical protein
MDEMTLVEKNKLINQFIGVGPTGFLANFTKQSLKDFYPAFCDLNIDPNEIEDASTKRFFRP